MTTENMTAAERLRNRMRLDAEKTKKYDPDAPKTSSGGDNASYQFWNMAFNKEAEIRLLPDGDPNNDFFWARRETIRLPFEGVVGGDYPSEKPASVTVPCVDMFDGNGACPIIAHMRPFWKDKDNKEAIALARLYYKKRSFIFQGFVKKSPFVEESLPENPIRRFVMGPMVFEIIEKSISNPKMTYLPCDYQHGREFIISKTERGDYPNYSMSSWSLDTSSLDETEMEAIAKFGLFNLNDYRGKRPTPEEMEMIKAMFKDSLDGKPFDFSSYGSSFRAYTNGNGNNDVSGGDLVVPASVASKKTVVQVPASTVSVAEPIADTTAESKPDHSAILAKIRARQQKVAEAKG